MATVSVLNAHRLLRQGLKPMRLLAPRPHGPAGFTWNINGTEGEHAGSIIVSEAPYLEPDGITRDWIHASVAFKDHTPSYLALRLLATAVFADRPSFQVFPPLDQNISIHNHALHLWGRADGTMAHPDFGQFGTI